MSGVKYFVDIFWFKCFACGRSNHQKMYCRLFNKEMIADANKRGVITYKCHHCSRTVSSQDIQVHDTIMEVSEQEARAKGITLDVQ